MRTVADDNALIGQHGAYRCHDSACTEVLPSIEASLDEPNSDEHTGKRQVSLRWRVTKGLPGDEDQYTSCQEDGTKTTEEVSHDLGEEARRWRCHFVATILGDAALDLIIAEALVDVDGEAATQLLDFKGMPFEASQVYLLTSVCIAACNNGPRVRLYALVDMLNMH